jgi:phosphatidylserine/phosphatidylglycerophosphate/cardiolipin synthase-like enzyme
MSVRDVNSRSGEALEALRQQMQENAKPTSTPQPQQQETFRQSTDPNHNNRLSQQFTRGKLSVGNSFVQKQLAAQLTQRASLNSVNQPLNFSREVLTGYMKTISNAAQKTSALRQIETEQSLGQVKNVIDNGKDSDRLQAGKVLEKTDSALQETDVLESMNKILDTFNDLAKMLTEMIKTASSGNAQPTQSTNPSLPTRTNSLTTTTGATEARSRLLEMGFSQTTTKKLSDDSATKLAGLDSTVLQSVGKKNLTIEQEFAAKINSLPQDSYDKLKSLPSTEQGRISNLSLEEMISELKSPTPTPTPTPSTDAATARTRLQELGFSQTTIKKLPDNTAVRLTKLDETLLKDTGKKNMTLEQEFAKKVGDLPAEAFDKLKALGGNDQAKLTALGYDELLKELTKTTKPPIDPPGTEEVKLFPMPDSSAAPIVDSINRAKESVDVSIYLFTEPKVLESLKQAAARGVQVRVMLEPQVVGQKDANKPIENELRAAGIEVKTTPEKYSEGNKVDHAKFMVIDKKELLFGTGNLVKSGLGEGDPNFHNRDFWVRDTRAQSVNEAGALFDADWERRDTTGIDFKNLVVTPDNASQKLFDFIDGAKEKLYVYNQSITDQPMIDRLIAAKQRGVDVKVMIGAPRGSTDKAIQTKAKLEAAGIDVAYYRKYETLHAKAMVADNKAYIGSQNFTSGGLYNNREFGEITDSPGVVKDLTNIFINDLKTTGIITGDITQEAEKVRIHKMPDSTSKPIVDAINSASKTIDLEVYQLTDVGVTEALKAAAKRGVQVRVMLEPKPVGEFNNYAEKAADLQSAGVQVKETPPEFNTNNNVDHAKFMIIDGRDMLFGTGNLTKGGLGEGAKPEWNNIDFWVEDTRAAAVKEGAQLFERDWNRQSTSDINFKYLVLTPDNANSRIGEMIDGAKERLYVYNQSLSDQAIIDKLISAKQRGVDVHVLLGRREPSPDNPNQVEPNKRALDLLQAAGVQANYMNRNYLHAKGIVADNKTFIGSQNFTGGGLIRNREVGQIFDDPKLAEQLAQSFLGDEVARTAMDVEGETNGVKNFFEVQPGVYRGGSPEINLTPADPKNLKDPLNWMKNNRKIGIEVDFRDPAEVPASETASRNSSGIQYVNIALPDAGTPNGSQINQFFSVIDRAKAAQQADPNSSNGVYVHDSSTSKYRSGLMTALLQIREGAKPDAAISAAKIRGLVPEFVAKNGNKASDVVDFLGKYGDAYQKLRIAPGSANEQKFNTVFADFWANNKTSTRTDFAKAFASAWAKA